jgi:hypothetical protein
VRSCSHLHYNDVMHDLVIWDEGPNLVFLEVILGCRRVEERRRAGSKNDRYEMKPVQLTMHPIVGVFLSVGQDLSLPRLRSIGHR